MYMVTLPGSEVMSSAMSLACRGTSTTCTHLHLLHLTGQYLHPGLHHLDHHPLHSDSALSGAGWSQDPSPGPYLCGRQGLVSLFQLPSCGCLASAPWPL